MATSAPSRQCWSMNSTGTYGGTGTLSGAATGGPAWPPTNSLSASPALKVLVVALIAATVYLFAANPSTSGPAQPGSAPTDSAPAQYPPSAPTDSAPAQYPPSAGEPSGSTAAESSVATAPENSIVAAAVVQPSSADYDGSLLAQSGVVSLWNGSIDGDIDFTLSVQQTDSIVHGELTYASTGIPILVVGQSTGDDSGSYFLREWAPTGESTGVLYLGDVADGVVGNAMWGELATSITKVGEVAVTTDRSSLTTPTPGDFRYDLNDGESNFGTLSIFDVTDTTIRASIHTVGSAPALNLAIVRDAELTLDANRATWTSDDGDPRCSFTITVFEQFVVVEQVEPFETCRSDSGFGNNATVLGTYVRAL